MRNLKTKIVFIFLFTLCCACIGSFKKEQTTEKSVFDQEEYFYMDQTGYAGYEWNENSRKADSLYIQGLVDHFFNNEYQKAIAYFLRARDIYPQDVRLYIRLIESYARINQYDAALREIERANQEITGFLESAGIIRYREELIAAQSGQLVTQSTKKGIFGTIAGIPGGIWRLIKKLWIF